MVAPSSALARRAISIPAITLAWALATALAPVALGLAALADRVRPTRPWARCRALLALEWILCCEVAGLLGAAIVWSLAWTPARRIAGNAALQRAWTGALFGGARRLFGLALHTEGLDQVGDGPFVLLVRHVSTLDTVLAAAVLANPRRLLLRYVLKRELLWDPCIDVVGHRLHNVFVARDGALRDQERAAVADLARGLRRGDAVLIYPEGTRFTPRGLERARAALRERAPAEVVARVERLRHLMPPRPGGTGALLAAEPPLDVVVLGHVGLEGARTLAELWRGALIGQTVRVVARRHGAAELPPTAEAKNLWLLDRWLELDAWVDAVSRAEVAA